MRLLLLVEAVALVGVIVPGDAGVLRSERALCAIMPREDVQDLNVGSNASRPPGRELEEREEVVDDKAEGGETLPFERRRRGGVLAVKRSSSLLEARER